jgi:hypothetical protein
MNSPFERLLDDIDWQPIAGNDGYDDDIPCATHQGILHIGDLSLRVYQLSNGKRMIAEDDLIAFFSPTDQTDGK